jgi:hypothetical protein
MPIYELSVYLLARRMSDVHSWTEYDYDGQEG